MIDLCDNIRPKAERIGTLVSAGGCDKDGIIHALYASSWLQNVLEHKSTVCTGRQPRRRAREPKARTRHVVVIRSEESLVKGACDAREHMTSHKALPRFDLVKLYKPTLVKKLGSLLPWINAEKRIQPLDHDDLRGPSVSLWAQRTQMTHSMMRPNHDRVLHWVLHGVVEAGRHNERR
jgi:hypothetical protein